MNIKCPECGNENQLGAIFCRGCGAKLDIESIRPEIKDAKVGGGLSGLFHRLMMVLSLLIALGVLAALFLPYGLRKFDTPSEDVVKAATLKYDALLLKVEGGRGPVRHVFTPVEAMAIINNMFLQKQTGDVGASYAVDDVLFDVSAAGELIIGLDAKLYGKVPVRFELIGKPTVSGGDAGAAPSFGFEIVSASMGRVSMPVDILKAKLAEKFTFIVQAADAVKIMKVINGIEVDPEGNIVVSFPEAKAPILKK